MSSNYSLVHYMENINHGLLDNFIVVKNNLW